MERSVNLGGGCSLSKQGQYGITFFPNFSIHSFKLLYGFLPQKSVVTERKERRIKVFKHVPVNSNLLELKKEVSTLKSLNRREGHSL